MSRVFAPASIGNVSVGFDVLGAALAPVDGSLLGDVVAVEPAASASFELTVTGRYAHKLPDDAKQNILYQCEQTFAERLQQRGIESVPVHMTLTKALPIGSGLGSSAASIVAAIHALNEFYDKPLDNDELLLLMGELEGQISGSVHYDNVAPCFLGGLQLMPDFAHCISLTVPYPPEWYWVVAYPGITISTAAARKILPEHYSRADLIQHSRLLATFIHAMHTHDTALASQALQDVVAEPYRRQLLPNFAAIKEQLLAAGALGMGISGSGPTLFAITDDWQRAQQMQQLLDSEYLQNEDGFSHICRLAPQGSQRLSAETTTLSTSAD